MAIFSQLAAIMLPVYITVTIGFFWARSNRTLDVNLIEILVYKIAFPCLIIAIFSRVESNIPELKKFVLASILVVVVGGVIGAILIRIFKFSLSSNLPPMTFSLTGSVGLPVCLFSYGDEGVAYGLVFFMVTAITTFRSVAVIAAGKLTINTLAREPIIWALILAVFLICSEFSLPKWIIDTTWLLGAIVIPLQLLVLGSFLGRVKPKIYYRAGIFSIVQLCIGLILGVLITEIFNFSMTARAILILQAAIPIEKSNYVFSILFKRDPTDVPEMVFVSTIICALALPLILAWLLNNG